MTDAPFPNDNLREAGLRAARLGEAAERNGDLAQAINLYRQSIHDLEQASAPEAAQVWQRLTAAELKLKLAPAPQTQGDDLNKLIDSLAGMSDDELAVYLKRLAKQMGEHKANEG